MIPDDNHRFVEVLNSTAMNYPLLFTLLITASCLATVPVPEPLITNVPNRTAISLDGDWQTIVDPYKSGYYDYRRRPFDQQNDPKPGAYFLDSRPKDKSDRVEYAFDQSPSLKVPGTWGLQVPELFWYEGALWYRRQFDLPVEEGQRYFIHFGAANYEAHAWLNGKKLGIHVGGFTPFNFEITDLVQPAGNFLVVMVDNSRHKSAVPTVATDWWNHGGLTRSVQIIAVPEAFVRDYTIGLSRDGLLIEGTVQIDPARPEQPVAVAIPELEVEWTGVTDADGLASFQIPAGELDRWEPGNPRLYDVIVTHGTDSMSDRIGFRTIEVKGKDILLNGKKIFLSGICMHEENPISGDRNHSAEHARIMFDWVQDLGANFARLAHYPHNENMPRLADELGILLWEEIPVYWTIDWNNPDTLANAKNQLRELITRDRNRASVIVWSLANETPVGKPRNAFLGDLARTARGLDASRLISAAMEVRTEGMTKILDDPFGQHTDIISFNQYHGWYGGNRDQFPQLNWMIAYDKPVIVSEWGAGALHGLHGDKDTMWSEEYQAHLYRKTLEGIDRIPGFSGMTPWILADFRSPRRALPVIQNMWNRKGLIGEGGHKKEAFYILKEYYTKRHQPAD